MFTIPKNSPKNKILISSTFWKISVQFLTNSKSEVPSWDSSPNFGLGVFFRNSFSNHPSTHPSTHPPGKVFVSYVGGRFLNKSCLSILVGIKNGYCNSWWPKYGPQVPKEWFESIYPLILWQSKTERKLIADWGSKWRCSFFNVQFWIYKFLIS